MMVGSRMQVTAAAAASSVGRRGSGCGGATERGRCHTCAQGAVLTSTSVFHNLCSNQPCNEAWKEHSASKPMQQSLEIFGEALMMMTHSSMPCASIQANLISASLLMAQMSKDEGVLSFAQTAQQLHNRVRTPLNFSWYLASRASFDVMRHASLSTAKTFECQTAVNCNVTMSICRCGRLRGGQAPVRRCTYRVGLPSCCLGSQHRTCCA